MSRMLTKEEYFKKLRNHESYQMILKKAPDEATRRRIISTVETVAGSMYDGIIPVMGAIKSDPEAASKISEALKNGSNIIKENDGSSIVSGSKG